MPEFLLTDAGRRIAHHFTPGKSPGVVFLGGFRSDMEGTKALFLEDWARKEGRAFLRFDYSGHGSSSGAFEDGAIGDWADDAAAIIAAKLPAPHILVGSSMGGWIALLLARARPETVAGLVTIAAAPDFTRRIWHDEMDEPQREAVIMSGRLEAPSAYSDEPYVFTRRLFEDGAEHLVLDDPLHLPFPVRFLQGTADEDVPEAEALRLLDHASGPDMRLTLVKGADHRFSGPEELALIGAALAEVAARAGDAPSA